MSTQIYLGLPPPNVVKWIKEHNKPAFKLTDPLCFTAEEPNAKLTFNKGNEDNQIVISTDKQNWSSYEYGTEITLANVDDKVYFRAADGIDNQSFGNYKFDINNGKIAASGNLNTLLKADGSVLDLTGRNRCYADMFMGCSSLTQAPELPATILSEYCYNFMFYNCSSLTQAPELPATTLAKYCYSNMFDSCTSLTQAPSILPAMTLDMACYYNMFSYCTSLTQAPELPATTLADSCYSYMFNSCKSPFTFSDKTFDEVSSLIQEYYLIGGYWCDENDETINPIEIICSDKTMLATYDENEYTWTLTEK